MISKIRLTRSRCECCGELRQIDGELPDKTPVRIMQSEAGFHVSVGEHPDTPPAPVHGRDVLSLVSRLWNKVREVR
jgi:hypothetical protein